jgi:predicted ATP-binding protein involved in virulence
MQITKVIIENYRCLRNSKIALNKHLNIIVGDNECGKSTFLEAINLALSGLLNGRPIAGELHPYLFNLDAVSKFIADIKEGKTSAPPSAVIELYMTDDASLAVLKGTNNSEREDVPGVSMLLEFNEDYKNEYMNYIADPKLIKTIPIEYYAVRWRSFAGNEIQSRSIPIKPTFIDASTIRNNVAANRYVLDTIKDSLTEKQRVDLALSYRMMKDRFLSDAKVHEINESLVTKKGVLSDKVLTISLDASSRASWETGVMPHLDDVPMTLVGKGEQNSVKIKLAMESSEKSHLFLIEEAENHLSYSNLNALIKHISERRGDRQLIITTHSSFVMNKLGIESVLLFSRGKAVNLDALPEDTRDYFLKLPGYDTLRLILAKRAILVEGPSDELIVQKAFYDRHGRLPLEAGVDVIAVGALAFKRFLQIATLLDTSVGVVTDNDGDTSKLKSKYADYLNIPHINLYYDDDEEAHSLEEQLLKANGLEAANRIVGKNFHNESELLSYMRKRAKFFRGRNSLESAGVYCTCNQPMKRS